MALWRLYPSTDGPSARVADTASYTLGTEFYVTSAAKVTALFLWRPADAPATNLSAGVYQVNSSTTGTLLASKTGLSTSLTNGWYRVDLDTPVDIAANTRYVSAFFSNTSNFYCSTPNYWITGGPGAAGLISGILKAPERPDTSAAGQSRYITGGASLGYPKDQFNSSNYWIDVEVDDLVPVAPTSGDSILLESSLGGITLENGNNLLI